MQTGNSISNRRCSSLDSSGPEAPPPALPQPYTLLDLPHRTSLPRLDPESAQLVGRDLMRELEKIIDATDTPQNVHLFKRTYKLLKFDRMAFHRTVAVLLFSTALRALAENTTSTTLVPVFTYPNIGTSTIYQTTATETNSVDCAGSVLVVSTFPASTIGPGVTNTATVTSPKTTSSEFTCLPSTSIPMNVTTTSFPPLNTPTAAPLPPINETAQTLIDELRTAILYASLIANGGNEAKICSAINPVSLSNGTGLNGVAVQNEVCATAAIQKFIPALGKAVVLSNQIGLQYLTVALFAVQVLSGMFIR
ncbi:MAG: hypothetical protein Q9216_003079 [Gyalolechia sp. 2 TL-2023]